MSSINVQSPKSLSYRYSTLETHMAPAPVVETPSSNLPLIKFFYIFAKIVDIIFDPLLTICNITKVQLYDDTQFTDSLMHSYHIIIANIASLPTHTRRAGTINV